MLCQVMLLHLSVIKKTMFILRVQLCVLLINQQALLKLIWILLKLALRRMPMANLYLALWRNSLKSLLILLLLKMNFLCICAFLISLAFVTWLLKLVCFMFMMLVQAFLFIRIKCLHVEFLLCVGVLLIQVLSLLQFLLMEILFILVSAKIKLLII